MAPKAADMPTSQFTYWVSQSSGDSQLAQAGGTETRVPLLHIPLRPFVFTVMLPSPPPALTPEGSLLTPSLLLIDTVFSISHPRGLKTKQPLLIDLRRRVSVLGRSWNSWLFQQIFVIDVTKTCISNHQGQSLLFLRSFVYTLHGEENWFEVGNR